MSFVSSFLKRMFTLKRKEKLHLLPRGYRTDYDKHVSRDVEKVFAQSGVRSPDGIDRLMRRHKVSSIDELLPLLPDPNRKVKPLERFGLWVMRLEGRTPYEATINPSLRNLNLPRGRTLIRRTQHRP